MKHAQLDFEKGFRVVFREREVQAAEMVIPPGQSEGGPGNRHRGADQWLFVVAGEGEAIVDGAKQPLREGSLIVIAHGEVHEIRNTGRDMLKTLNVYSPPAYDENENELPAGER